MENLVPIVILAAFPLALVLERLFPARPLPEVRGWFWKGVLFFVLGFALNGAVPMLVAAALGGRAPLHLGALGVVGGGVAGFLVSDFVSYWVHRLMHRVPFLWRWTHQMHHSAERMDVAGLAYAHPLDTLTAFLFPGLAVALLGLTAEAGAVAGLLGFFFALIQHANIRTPRWLGYVMQRPEAHGVHHQRGVHAYNYGSFPLWDMLFGTFRNPAAFPREYGFWDGASRRLGAMMLGRDVGAPPAPGT